MRFNMVATCLFGLEKIAAFELKRAGAEDVQIENGRIFFTADEWAVAAANIWSRTSERILMVLARYPAADFDALFDGAMNVRWADYIGRTDAFPVKGYSMNSRLTSVPALQSVLKKAIVERLKRDYNSSFLTEKSGVTKQVRFSVVKDECTLMLDTSGTGLHKRGYRPLAHEAPIKETLAAGIADLARIGSGSDAADPFCGSGTLLIEAALRARNIAPGLRRAFAGESYDFLGKKLFDDVRAEAEAAINRDAAFHAFGSDIDEAAIDNARQNAKRAGVADAVEFAAGDARAFRPKPDMVMLANPPYGERLLDERESEALVRDFFRAIDGQAYKGLYIISSHPDFEQVVAKKATRRRSCITA